MTVIAPPAVFLLGNDYHLGDLLWLIPVLNEYRRQRHPSALIVGCPDRDISRILENAPPVDRIVYGDPDRILSVVTDEFADNLVVEDLRMFPVAVRMLRAWRHRLPWLYYWDLWVQPRGQWLATLLGLGTLSVYKPEIKLTQEDSDALPALPPRFILFAPHTGSYSLPALAYLWRKIKGWDVQAWQALARLFEEEGYCVFTVGALSQSVIPGTRPLLGLPIRQAAALIDGATALVTGESGLWFVAAAVSTPFVIVPWWLPASIDWPAVMGVRYRRVTKKRASPARVHAVVQQLLRDQT